jgi:hypothetical protein
LSFDTPVLLTIHSRPDTTLRVFEIISRIKPAYLFIAADGPRDHVESDKLNCAQAREIVDKIDWECELHTLFRQENLGCRMAMSTSITWFFDNVDKGIILEDDCLPEVDFFYFCDEMLERYKKNEDVFVVAGNNFQKISDLNKKSYYFSRYMHCWGWASWSRAWDKFDNSMSNWPKMKSTNKLDEVLDDNSQVKYWTSIFDDTYCKKIDSWAYVWMYSCWYHNGMTIIPGVNLVKNIGFDDDATHTSGRQGNMASCSSGLEFPLLHPKTIMLNVDADKWTERVLYSGSMPKKIMRAIKAFLIE